MGPEKDFPPRVPAMMNVAHIFADKVTNNWRVNLPHQIRGKNKPAIQGNHDIQTPALALSRNLFSENRDAGGNSLRGKHRCFSHRQVCRSTRANHKDSSATTIPARVLSSAA